MILITDFYSFFPARASDNVNLNLYEFDAVNIMWPWP